MIVFYLVSTLLRHGLQGFKDFYMDSREFKLFVTDTALRGHCSELDILNAFKEVAATDSKLQKLIKGLEKEYENKDV